MQEFSQNMLSQTHSMEQKVDGLVDETKVLLLYTFFRQAFQATDMFITVYCRLLVYYEC
jgi:hypothetical protein